MASLSGRLVLDASVVVECLGDFTHPGQARSILEAAASDLDIELWAPDLVYPESVSALRKLASLGALSAPEADVGVDRILRLPLYISSTAALMTGAWALRGVITVYDACYAVLAQRLDGTLVTADGALARALEQVDVRVVELAGL